MIDCAGFSRAARPACASCSGAWVESVVDEGRATVTKGGAPDARRRPVDGSLRVLALAALCVAVIVSAWVCDDALITSRTIDQLLHGHGLRFNPAERVQAFTHPLWLFVVTPFQAATGEALFASVLPSLACTAGAAFCVLRAVAPGARAGWVAVGVLVSSKAFVDYSTSGLENPLTHLWLAAFAWRVLPPRSLDARRMAEASAIAALLFTTRMDAALMLAPLALRLAYEAWRDDAFASRASAALLAASPALLWLGFSWLYFGQLLPNTAQAKLATGIDRGALVEQGLRYLRVFAALDPAGVVALASGLLVTVGAVRDARMRAWGAGAALYVAYVVWIGGDFMAGRFLSGPVLMAAVALGRAAAPAGIGSAPEPAPAAAGPSAAGPSSDWPSRYAPLAAALCVGLSLASPASPLRASIHDAHTAEGASQDVDVLPAHGIVDERLWYYARTGLLSSHREAGLEPESACRPEIGRAHV